MWIRTRLDIRWRDLVIAACGTIFPGRREANLARITSAWNNASDLVVTLSVRSAFDLLLRALALPPGSEVLMSAITVPGMVEIAKRHDLKVVPVDIDQNGDVVLQSLHDGLSPRSRLCVIAHLFGKRAKLTEIREMLHVHESISGRDILLIEDCAQSYAGIDRLPSHCGDVALYSFGPIKTATALGGGIAIVNDSHLRRHMKNILASDPIQSNTTYAKRIIRHALINAMTSRVILSAIYSGFRICRVDPDNVILKLARGFSGDDLITQIRFQPSTALSKFLAKRLERSIEIQINQRIENGQFFANELGIEPDFEHSYSAFGVAVKNRNDAIRGLRKLGLDATARTRLCVVTWDETHRSAASVSATPQADWLWEHVVFIPCYPGIPRNTLRRAAMIVRQSVLLEHGTCYASVILRAGAS